MLGEPALVGPGALLFLPFVSFRTGHLDKAIRELPLFGSKFHFAQRTRTQRSGRFKESALFFGPMGSAHTQSHGPCNPPPTVLPCHLGLPGASRNVHLCWSPDPGYSPCLTETEHKTQMKCWHEPFGHVCVHEPFGHVCVHEPFGHVCVHEPFGHVCMHEPFGHVCVHEPFSHVCVHMCIPPACRPVEARRCKMPWSWSYREL